MIENVIDIEQNPNKENYNSLYRCLRNSGNMSLELYSSKKIDELISTLSPKKQKVIKERFGLESGRKVTLEEVKLSIGVSRERARQIEDSAIKELRCLVNSRRVNYSYLKKSKWVTSAEKETITKLEEEICNSNIIIRPNKNEKGISQELVPDIDPKVLEQKFDILREIESNVNEYEKNDREETMNALEYISINDFNFSTRQHHILQEAGLLTAKDIILLTKKDLMQKYNCKEYIAGEIIKEIRNVKNIALKGKSDIEGIISNIESQTESIEHSSEESIEKNKKESMKIEELNLSFRSYKALKKANCNTVEDIISLSVEDIEAMKGIGEISAQEIINKIHFGLGLKFNENVEENSYKASSRLEELRLEKFEKEQDVKYLVERLADAKNLLDAYNKILADQQVVPEVNPEVEDK